MFTLLKRASLQPWPVDLGYIKHSILVTNCQYQGAILVMGYIHISRDSWQYDLPSCLCRLWRRSWSMLVKLHFWHSQDYGLGCILSKHFKPVSNVSYLTTLLSRLLISAKEKMMNMTRKTYWHCCWKHKMQSPSTRCLKWKSMMKYWHFYLVDLRPPHHSYVGCYTTWVSAAEW